MKNDHTYKNLNREQFSGQEIAIVGMAGRFPGARNIDELWENLHAGKESISFFSDAELLAAGIAEETLRNPQYVKARGVLEGVEEFDAAFFGFTPREAEIIDPQQRIFLECAWEAVEHAGVDVTRFQKPIGVFAGASLNTYLSNNIYANADATATLDHYQLLMGNGTDFLTTRVSYKLNLSGPSIAVQTGCSTSLVAIHLACQSLLSGECDMSLAGGVAITLPQKTGYFYAEGGIGSPDGHCRAFDEKSQGIVGGSGVGIVALKRLEDALNDGDTIHALIKGTAINNDGSAKIGYTAPSIDGQAEVIRAAYLAAEVDPETITYVEAHGTGTPLGDPIEIAALNQAFKAETAQTSFCALGSIKTNIGHLDTAAGVAGLIKTVLALKHQEIPPSLHFHKANPKIDFQDSPFYVNTTLTPWPEGSSPRRAGVSSFGVGGTNCHVILEEAPVETPTSSEDDNSWKLLMLSAQTQAALDRLTRDQTEYVRKHVVPLKNAAYTLRTGRKAFQYRRSVVCRNSEEAIQVLEDTLATGLYTQARKPADCSIAFLFSGQGTQHVNMGRDLYENEPIFHERVADCARILTEHLGIDIREILYPSEDRAETAAAMLSQTWLTQPALFTIEYAIASLWMYWGIQPQAMLGHSIGEYVVACLAGVFTLEDALRLVAIRGRLMQQLPEGAMIALNPADIEPHAELQGHLSLAAINSPSLHVLSGSIEDIQAFTQELEQHHLQYRRLHTSHAFHSCMMDAIVHEFSCAVRQVTLLPPEARYISNVSGTWITAAEATDPDYWVRHLRQTVQFAAGIQELSNERNWLFLEIGAGNTLSSLVRQNIPTATVYPSLRRMQEQVSDQAFILQTLGKLWQAGVQHINWEIAQPGEHTRIPLPTYPFERHRHWIESSQAKLNTRSHKKKPEAQKRAEITDWCYQPIWKPAPLEYTHPETANTAGAPWLIFKDQLGVSAALMQCLATMNITAIAVEAGVSYSYVNKHTYTINAATPEDYIKMFSDLRKRQSFPSKIISLWPVTPLDECPLKGQHQKSFSSLLSVAQALGTQELLDPLDLWCISNGVYRVLDNERFSPAKATLLGPCQVIPQEYTQVRCGHIDISLEEGENVQLLVEQLLSEMLFQQPAQRVAYRAGRRWQQIFEAVTLQKELSLSHRLKSDGTYMITGGLGGIGLTLAATITKHVKANLILLGRSPFPETEQWPLWLQEHAAEDTISLKIRQIQALELNGARIHIVQADIADLEKMRAVLEQATTLFGPVNGVIHAAGVAGGGAMQFKKQAEIERIWAAKVQGTLVLTQLFQQEPLDFLILCSSLSAVTGGFGQADYCAANAFMDAMAQQTNAPYSSFTCAINWDIWQDVGMAANTVLPEDLQRQRASSLHYGISPQEGAALFALILSNEYTHVLVSTRDLQAVLKTFTITTSSAQKIEPEYSSNLSLYQRPELTNEYIAPRTQLEQSLIRIWSTYMGIEKIGLHDNFFELGGHSLIMAQIHSELQATHNWQIALVDLLTYPTIHLLAQFLDQQHHEPQQNSTPEREGISQEPYSQQLDGIAIVGMAGRFPGANDIETFWQNIRNGVESIAFFSPEELREEGVAEAQLNDPHYVKAGAILADIEQFDASFFGYSPKEAEGIDPQQRLFLESSWQALECAGYDAERFDGAIGVYGGLSMSTYLLSNLQAHPDLLASSQFMMGNVADFLATRVSYKLNLRGPSITVQTACSTSLVAIHLACEDLRAGKCDIALAGGASVRVPHKRGYLYDEGGIASPDGHCRAFDAQAQGTIFGNGVGVVALKRLAEAIADNDTIYAVIKGSAINNDGSVKAGFTAPSVQGQTAAIIQALNSAQIAPETISYVETHGTGTILGDPIEIMALTNALTNQTAKKGFCAIGSVKTNIGHLDVAAGVTGLIKTALALKHKEIPASLHFQQPNPQIDFANTPFYVNTQLKPWVTADGHPRRAGVSAFGLGGTNAHVILEEAPTVTPDEHPQQHTRSWHLLSLAAKTPAALEVARLNLVTHLQQHPELLMADVSYTLHIGRRAFAHRLIGVCQNNEDAQAVLQSEDPSRLFTGLTEASQPSLAFMFPGGGSQYIDMGRDLYEDEKVFREAIDRCVQLFNNHLYYDLKEALYPEARKKTEMEQQIHKPGFALPLIFTTEYALAQLLMSWEIRPHALIGHSLGEYVAAVLAEVFTLEDAIELVVLRGHLLEQVPDGAMVSLPLSEQDVQPLLRGSLSLAAVNNSSGSVIAGTVTEISTLEQALADQGIEGRRLHISTAAHSALLDPVLETFARFLAGLTLHTPRLPFISNVSGTWITEAEATSPDYWVKHLRQTVRFADGIQVLLQQPRSILLEVGPSHTLSVLVRQQLSETNETVVLTSLRHAQKQQSDVAFLLQTVGRLWLAGVDIAWESLHGKGRSRVLLPTYAFERKRYWLDARKQEPATGHTNQQDKKQALADWFYIPSWHLAPSQVKSYKDQPEKWLLFVDDAGTGMALANQLLYAEQEVIIVRAGTHFQQVDKDNYILSPGKREDYNLLLNAVKEPSSTLHHIVNCWSITGPEHIATDEISFRSLQERGYYSLLWLAQALEKTQMIEQYQCNSRLDLIVITNESQSVTYTEISWPEKAPLLGICKVLQQEYQTISCRLIDTMQCQSSQQSTQTSKQLFAELITPSNELVVAFRGLQRWVHSFEPLPLPENTHPLRQFRQKGIYLITGGLGGIGLALAEHLARKYQATLILTGRSAFPARDQWSDWLSTHSETEQISAAIKKLRTIESLGSEVFYFSADVADEIQMQEIVHSIYQRFQALHGVIHAAGITHGETYSLINEMDQYKSEAQFQSKVYGLYVLEKVLRGKDLDFCLLLSSNASILGGLSFVAYTAANQFVDAFAAYQSTMQTVPWISTNWDGWQTQQTELRASVQSSIDRYALNVTQAIEALERIVWSAPTSQVIVSSSDLLARVRLWIKREIAPVSATEETQKALVYYSRQENNIKYVAPHTEIEQTIAEIWQDLLGIERIGIYDNYFELGGHSLLAIQIVAHLRAKLHVELPLGHMFAKPNIAELAEYILQNQGIEEHEQTLLPLDAFQIQHNPSAQHAPFPLNDIQQAYWIGRNGPFELSNVSSHSYVEFEYKNLDLKRFEGAWQKVIARHEMLRAIFLPDGQQQILAEVPPFRIGTLDLRGADPEFVVQTLENVRQQMSHQLLAADHWPLFEVRAFVIDNERTRIHISIDALLIDAWSSPILERELVHFYEQPEDALPPLQLTFRDYILAEEKLHQSALYEKSRDYWLKRLPTLPLAPDIPLAKHPGTLVKPHFVRRSVRIKAEHWQQLKSFTAQHNLTPSAVLLTAFSEVLATWSKTPRFTLNLTLFNRLPLHAQVNKIIGVFTSINLLEMSNALQESFETRARHTQEQLWNDLDHRYMSGVQVLRELTHLHGESNRATMPVVFTSTLTQSEETKSQHFSTTQAKFVYGISQTPQVWLDHHVGESEGELQLNWDAVEELFPAGLLDDMFAAYQQLVQKLASNKEAWLETDRQLLPPYQQAQWAAANHTAAPISSTLLHTLFAEQVAQHSQNIAVVAANKRLTYQELASRANRLGRYLRKNGAVPNTLVAVVMEKGWEQVVATLGILNAGAAYLPLDPQLPAERLLYLLEHAEVQFIITQSWLRNCVSWPEGSECIYVDTDALHFIDDTPLPPVQRPQDLAYVIYTSGSTGKPKGVMIDHQGAVNTILDLKQRFGLTTHDKVLALSSLSFDLSVYDIFGLLAAGGTIVLPPPQSLRDPAVWLQLLQQEQVTLWNTVPALMQALLDYVDESTTEKKRQLSALRLTFLSGDWIPLALPKRIHSFANAARIISMGGATEASIWSIIYDVKEIDPGWKSIPYGKAMLNQTFYVLDERLEERPAWVPGNLYIGGIGLAKGYWHDFEKTQASFITHPRTGARLYRTGDLGRYYPDGNIEFLGREDFQVKIQGFRVELGEIEYALTQHPEIHAAVVTAMSNDQGGKSLVAYVVPQIKTPENAACSADNSQLTTIPAHQKNHSATPVAAIERLAFKSQQPSLREDIQQREAVQLIMPTLDAARKELYYSRQSQRTYLQEMISFAQFSALLDCLLQIELEDFPFPKHRYASAGSLYPVQCYIYIKPRAIEQLEAGIYYYHPATHKLVLLTPGANIDCRIHAEVNQPVFNNSAFSLFLIGKLQAIAPLYGEAARDYCLLEAGYMSQLLMMTAANYHLGLCPIGGLNFAEIRDLFCLDDDSILLHGLAGGSVDPQSAGSPPEKDQEEPPSLVDKLKHYLEQQLPKYMQPTTFSVLEHLPLSSNGKIDRKALPLPVLDAYQDYTAPRDALEQKLAHIWMSLLGLERISIHDNYFLLGGDSLQIIKMVTRAKQAGIPLTYIQVIMHQTIAELAQALVAQIRD